MADRIPLYGSVVTLVPVLASFGRARHGTILPADATGVLLDYLGADAGIVELGIDSDGIPDGIAHVLLSDLRIRA